MLGGWHIWGLPRQQQCPQGCGVSPPADFSLFSYNNGMVMTSCRDLDGARSALSATSAFAIATAGANEGTPTKEKYRRMSLASAGTCPGDTCVVPIVPRGVSLQAGRAPSACSREPGHGSARGTCSSGVAPGVPVPPDTAAGEGGAPWAALEGLWALAEGPLAVSGFPTDQRNGDKEFVIRRAATNRVLNVLRHWVSKHSQVGTPRGSLPPTLTPGIQLHAGELSQGSAERAIWHRGFDEEKECGW